MADVYIPAGTVTLSGIANGDSVYFMEGSQTVTAGKDLSALTTLVDVVFGERFSGIVEDLQFDSSGVVHYRASGGRVSLVANGTSTEVIAKVVHNGGGTLTLKTAGTFTEYQQSRGVGIITDEVNATGIRMTGGDLTQYYKSTANTNWTIAGGTFKTGRGFSGTANVTGKARVIVRREEAGSTSPTGATLNIADDAIVMWMGGNITTVNFLGPNAKLDLTNLPKDITITNATGFTKAFYDAAMPIAAGGTQKFANGKQVTLTNAATIYGGDLGTFAVYGGAPV